MHGAVKKLGTTNRDDVADITRHHFKNLDSAIVKWLRYRTKAHTPRTLVQIW